MDRDNPSAEAFAVRNGRFIAVGSLENVLETLESNYVISEEFMDQILVPGFIDQHLHPMLGATTLTTEIIAPENWNLPNRLHVSASSPDEYNNRLVTSHNNLPEGEWLFTWGWHHLWHGPMSKQRLDDLVGDRPTAVWQRSCHEWILNTAAIEKIGLTFEMTQGKGVASSQINWDHGHFWENGWMLVLANYLMPHFMTPERFRKGLNQLVQYLHMNGVTAINEPGIFWRNEPWDLYQEILGHSDVPFESTFLVEARTQPIRGLDPNQFVQDARSQVERGSGSKVRVLDKHVKLFCDGAIISQLMQMKDPYLRSDGTPDPDHHGEWIMEPDELKQVFDVYWDEGWQIHVHVNGDHGLEVLLEILEMAQNRHPRIDHRTVIVHFANSTESQVQKIAQLGAIVSANPYYPVGFADKYGEWGLGATRADVMVRSASVLRESIQLSFHSDLPMCPSDPLLMMSFGINRITPSGRVAGPEQRISVHDALRAVTLEAAYSWRREHELGSIEVGKIANVTALDHDPYEIDPTRIGSIPIRTTMFDGRVFRIDAALVEQRRTGSSTQAALVNVNCIDVEHHGCSCEVAAFLLDHLSNEGWAA